MLVVCEVQGMLVKRKFGPGDRESKEEFVGFTIPVSAASKSLGEKKTRGK